MNKKMDYAEIRNTVEKLGNENYRNLIKALVSYEKGVNDENALDEIYEEFMDSDTKGLLHEDFDYMIEELRENGRIDETIEYSFKTSYNELQEEQIKLGKKHNIDTSIYEDIRFNDKQMKQIRLGLEYKDINVGIDVKKYANYKFSAEDMKNIREALIDVEKLSLDHYYADSFEQSSQISDKLDTARKRVDELIEKANVDINTDIVVDKDNFTTVVGNLLKDVEIIERKNENKQPFKVANLTLVSQDDNGERVYTNASAYGEKTNIIKNCNYSVKWRLPELIFSKIVC